MTMVRSQGGGTLSITSVIGLGIAATYIYMGVRVKTLLSCSPGFLKGVLLANAALVVFGGLGRS